MPAAQELLVNVEGRTLKISNLDKVLYPRTGTTKGEVLDYYARIAPTLLPHLEDRAVTRIRWPHGVQGESFFEKNVPAGTPSWVRTVRVPTTGSRAPRAPRGPRGATRWSSRSSTTSPPSRGWSTWPRSSCTSTSGPSDATGVPATPTGW